MDAGPPEQDWWNRAAAVEVSDILLARLYGRVPATVAEWVEAGERLGASIRFVDAGGEFRGQLLADGLVLVHQDRDPAIVCRVIAHELAEYLLRREVSAPINCGGNAAPFHDVARIVEDRMT